MIRRKRRVLTEKQRDLHHKQAMKRYQQKKKAQRKRLLAQQEREAFRAEQKALKKPEKKIAYKKAVLAVPPLTSEEQYKRTRKEQNALNRARSKAMENRVAKLLHGRRVLLSGAAAAYKGDVEVPLSNYPGAYIVECKLSAQVETKMHVMPMDFRWFPKLHEEAKNMNAKFGVLVINYLNQRNSYVFIRRNIIDLLITRYNSPYSHILQHALDTLPIVDMAHKTNGDLRTTYKLYKSTLDTNMQTIENIHLMRVNIPDGEYMIIHLEDFAFISHHI